MKNFLSDLFRPWSDETDNLRNELVFERLNKTYGAYEIRTHYDQTVRKSILGTCVLMGVLAFLFTSFRNTPQEKQELPLYDSLVVNPWKDPGFPDDPPPPDLGGPKDPNLDDLIPEVSTDSVIQPDTLELLAMNPKGPVDGNGVDSGLVIPGYTGGGGLVIDQPPVDTNTYVYGAIQEQPRFPGGDDELYKFLSKTLVYPEAMREIRAGGKVAIQFVVNQNGKLEGIHVLSGTRYPELNREALRVVGKMPDWEPGRQNGKPVRVQLILPIRFVPK